MLPNVPFLQASGRSMNWVIRSYHIVITQMACGNVIMTVQLI